MAQLENANPEIFQKAEEREVLPEEEDDDVYDEIDAREVFGVCVCGRGGHFIVFPTVKPHGTKHTWKLYVTSNLS